MALDIEAPFLLMGTVHWPLAQAPRLASQSPWMRTDPRAVPTLGTPSLAGADYSKAQYRVLWWSSQFEYRQQCMRILTQCTHIPLTTSGGRLRQETLRIILGNYSPVLGLHTRQLLLSVLQMIKQAQRDQIMAELLRGRVGLGTQVFQSPRLSLFLLLYKKELLPPSLTPFYQDPRINCFH